MTDQDDLTKGITMYGQIATSIARDFSSVVVAQTRLEDARRARRAAARRARRAA